MLNIATITIKMLTVLAIQGYNDGLPRATADSSSLHKILNIVIGIVAAISVLFVVVGGLRFVLSAGDPQAASRARSTVIYAVVGLVVAVAAEAIVAFVLSNSTLSGL
jgi:hypothetical protein